jgi:hypothetical protein
MLHRRARVLRRLHNFRIGPVDPLRANENEVATPGALMDAAQTLIYERFQPTD